MAIKATKDILSVWRFLFMFLLVAGCSPREPVPPPPPDMPSAIPASPMVAPVPDVVETEDKPEANIRPVVKKSVIVPPKTHPIRVTALMKPRSGPARVGVVQDSTGYWRMLHIGESFMGYRVNGIDYETETVTFDWRGVAVKLRLEGTVEKTVVKTETADTEHEAEAKLVRGKTNYAASLDERNRGIDPNDATTWPRGYRGPAIERIAMELENADAPFDLDKARAAQTFEPTSDEISRGIDPNDADTWPKGYRGPAIERLLQGRQMEEAPAAPRFNREPPEGTPEEIKQRFFDTYGPGASAPTAPTPQP